MTQKASPETVAALAALIILQVIMLTALYAGVRPHPPVETPLFGIAPFLGASIAAAVAALILPQDTRAGRIFMVLAAVLGAVSFGPQKYLDAQIGLIWPAVVSGQVAIVTLLVHAFARRTKTVEGAGFAV